MSTRTSLVTHNKISDEELSAVVGELKDQLHSQELWDSVYNAMAGHLHVATKRRVALTSPLFEDALAEAQLAVTQAVHGWTPSSNSSFGAYAMTAVHRRLSVYLARERCEVSMSRTAGITRTRLLARMAQHPNEDPFELAQGLHDEILAAEVKKQLAKGVPTQQALPAATARLNSAGALRPLRSRTEVAALLAAASAPERLDRQVNTDSNSAPVADRIANPSATVHTDSQSPLWDVLNTVPPAERAVFELRFGLSGEAPRTAAEVGAELGMSAVAVDRVATLVAAKMVDPIHIWAAAELSPKTAERGPANDGAPADPFLQGIPLLD